MCHLVPTEQAWAQGTLQCCLSTVGCSELSRTLEPVKEDHGTVSLKAVPHDSRGVHVDAGQE